MKLQNKILAGLLLLSSAVGLFVSCSKDTATDLAYGIKPNQYNLINRALIIGTGGKCIKGSMPTSSSGNNFFITQYPRAVQVTAGVVLYYNYQTSDTTNLCKVYLQIDSADSYWEVPVQIDPVSKQPYIKVLIPNFILNGNFKFNMAVGSCTGGITPIVNTNILVTDPLSCGSSFSGSVGITAMVAKLDDKAGKVRITYNMYSIPDRLDVRYSGSWVASTGTPLSPIGYPNCNVSDGFVSGSNFVEFNYDPKTSKYVEVYVSGCNSGTAWDIQVTCP
jgi:hypothetical protein